ncbi:hypothetical protein LWI28_013822 [Acer negundo]|uniref:CCHC-type domain-containing protein n=1 Tax=Acer negundo TaxID=4023 RepID=A0AAD5IZ11_ACENE|nr:hypothetical protein LWI28_013822 [Acer negundo]
MVRISTKRYRGFRPRRWESESREESTEEDAREAKKKNRKRQPDEPAKKKRKSGVQCGSCGEWGHNVRTCKGRGKNAKATKNVKNKPTSTTNTIAHKRTYEVGGSSKSAPRKRLSYGQTVGGTSSQTCDAINAATDVGVRGSQPPTSFAAQQSSQIGTQTYQSNNRVNEALNDSATVVERISRAMTAYTQVQSCPNVLNPSQASTSVANAGSQAGYDIDWSVLF